MFGDTYFLGKFNSLFQSLALTFIVIGQYSNNNLIRIVVDYTMNTYPSNQKRYVKDPLSVGKRF
jgi:hypothetical protein